DTPEKRKELIDFLQKQPFFCFDTETTGTDANTAELVGMSFAVKPGEAWYVPMPVDAAQCSDIVSEFKALFADEKIAKIGHNLKFDILMLNWCGVEVKGELSDTMLAHYLLDPDTRHNMDILAENYLNYSPVSITSLIGARGKKQGNMRDVELEKIKEYAAEDADTTLQLQQVFEPLLKQAQVHKLSKKLETPLIYVLAGMQREDINNHQGTLNEFSAELEKDIKQLELV